MKIRNKTYIGASLLLSLSMTTGGCGHSKGSSESVSETITAEEMMGDYTAYDLPMDTDKAPAREPVKNDTPAVAVSDSGNPAAMVNDSLPPEPPRKRVRTSGLINYVEVFNDSNHFQLAHAQRLGITPISDLRSYFHNRRPLVKIATNEDYVLEPLTHSYPYLIPEADRLLHDIGKNFRDSLRSRGAKEYRIVVTSVLRTPETVKRLRRVNGNATEFSTHQYATTFDLSYNKFAVAEGSDDVSYVDLKQILAEVLEDLHREGRCMIKYEIKSPCFHITVVR